MTIEELNTKRDEILSRAGTLRVQFGERSVQYSEAKDALALIDSEISRVTAAVNNNRSRTTYATFRND